MICRSIEYRASLLLFLDVECVDRRRLLPFLVLKWTILMILVMMGDMSSVGEEFFLHGGKSPLDIGFRGEGENFGPRVGDNFLPLPRTYLQRIRTLYYTLFYTYLPIPVCMCRPMVLL